MKTERLTAFSDGDGVVAVIITVMVSDLKTPHGSDLAALAGVVPTFLADGRPLARMTTVRDRIRCVRAAAS